MSIKQVTVFGGSGFVGRAIVRALAQDGYQVRVACRRIELAERIKTAGDVGQITILRTNLRIPASVAAAIAGSQAVINASGIAFQRGRQRYEAVHVTGARAIADAAKAAGVQRLVHISGIGADQRMDWAEGLEVPTIDDKPNPEYLLWVGCAGAFDQRIEQRMHRRAGYQGQQRGRQARPAARQQPDAGGGAQAQGQGHRLGLAQAGHVQ